MGIFEAGKKLAKKAITGQSKDDLIAERIFDLFSSKGFPSEQGLRGRGAGDYHFRRFESHVEGVKAVEVKVSRIGASGWRTGGQIGSAIGDLRDAIGPQRVKIEFELVSKEGGFLGRGKESKRYEFNINADEYIDDELRIKDEAAFQKVLNGYMKTLGYHLINVKFVTLKMDSTPRG